jgi:hypothetical protein
MIEGWKCPKCGRIWSPATDQCVRCNTQIIQEEAMFHPSRLRDPEAEASRLDAENLRSRVPPVRVNP